MWTNFVSLDKLPSTTIVGLFPLLELVAPPAQQNHFANGMLRMGLWTEGEKGESYFVGSSW